VRPSQIITGVHLQICLWNYDVDPNTHDKQYESKTFPVLKSVSPERGNVLYRHVKAFAEGRCDLVFLGKEWESPERITLQWKCKGRSSHGKYGGRYAKLLDEMNIACQPEYHRLPKKCRNINLKIVIRLADLRKDVISGWELSRI
jgi:hypothetical protein